ncbi:GDYXXLXY domain-containing protein [Roseateles chitinivorans]|uniref:GDYXXLXY domain-containing protein n=1 Tax=Roseateles chitinivorans TaxID=2917965 RepID=UPI003D66B093
MSGGHWIEQARAEGLAPADPPEAPRPWPVVLLTALGAWLAAVPFLAMFFALFGSAIEREGVGYFFGVSLIVLSVLMLRSRGIALFLEQAAVPLLITGLVLLFFALGKDLPPAGLDVVALLVGVGLILLLNASWMRVLLGVAMAAPVAHLGHLAFRELLSLTWYERHGGIGWALATLLLLVGVALLALQHQAGRRAPSARQAALLEPVLAGWWVAVLAAFAMAAGWSFAAGGALGGLFRGATPGLATSDVTLIWVSRAVSAVLTVAAATWLWRRWRPSGAARLVPPLLVLVALAAPMPALGGILLVLALTASTRRWRLAALAGAAAVWAIGALYYEWQLPLAHKSLALVAAGAVLAAWVRWLAWHPTVPSSEEVSRPSLAWRGARALLLGSGVLALVLVNVLIAARERSIAEGRPVFVKLAPVDPRSLMQGDYMRLSYELPSVGGRNRAGAFDWTPRAGDTPPLWGRRPQLAAVIDARGVVQSARALEPGEAPPPGTQLLELTPKGGGWTFVSDAWFFREGEAARWQPAKYGEFRVTPEGKGLLVRVVGEDLKPL